MADMAETQCTAPAETVESSSLAPEMTSDALTLELQAKADALVLEAERDEPAQAAEPQKKDDNLAPDGKVRCAKCRTEGDATNFVCRASYRPELRYVCKPCQALSQTLMRNGICIDKVLSENEILYFFQQASEERQNSEHKRLAYSQARAMLKKTVLHEVRKTKAERADAEWQPLTFWELQGYDVQSIALSAPSRQHAVLGTVYKVAIDKEWDETLEVEAEQRVLQIEHDARLRKTGRGQTTAPEDGVGHAAVDLPQVAVKEPKGQKRAATTVEKEEAKKSKAEARKAEAAQRVASNAGIKNFPSLQAVEDKLQKKATQMAKMPDFPAEDLAELEKHSQFLHELCKLVAAFVSSAASGKICEKAPTWKTDKDLQGHIKRANALVRNANSWLRAYKDHGKGGKENHPPNPEK